MKLTEKQLNTLALLKEEHSWLKNKCKIHNNMMNGLYWKKMVKISTYANGEFWELTDEGLNKLDEYER